MELLARRHGELIGVKYGEPFLQKEPMAVDDVVTLAVRTIDLDRPKSDLFPLRASLAAESILDGGATQAQSGQVLPTHRSAQP